MKVVSIDSLNSLTTQIKLITSQTKLHVNCKHGLGLHTRGIFVCIFRCLDISNLLDEDNDLEEEIAHLFNEASIFILKQN